MNSISLKEVAELITKGTTPSSVGCAFTSDGINFIKSESITGSKYLNNLVYEHIDELTDEKLKRSRLNEGDLLVSIAGAYLGKIAIVQACDVPANTNQAVGIVRLNKTLVDINYVYYYFSQKHINSYINNLSAQSSQPNLNLDLLGKLKFDLKKLNVQKKIAAVLSSLDSKIEINNKINVELEAMAKTIYDYWFVQFDFPNAKGKPYKTSGGKMVWNEDLKREIPEGWEVQDLSKIANITTGKLDSNAEVIGAKYPFYTCAADPSTTDTFAFDDTAILIAGNNATGNFHINRYKGKFNAYQRTYIVTSKHSDELEYLYQVLKTETKALKSQGKGSQTKFLTIGMLTCIKTYTNTGVMKDYSDLVTPLYEQQVNVRFQNQQLASLRDWLLPMLMNGQVKVEDAENSDSYRKVEEKLSMAAEEKGVYKKSKVR